MQPYDLHVHTTASDGTATPEEMVKAAIKAGMAAIGFSDHAHTPCDESYCMKAGALDDYRKTIAALRECYRDRIAVYGGIEQDYYADTPTDGLDYVIGSVHYLRFGEAYIPVDEGNDVLRDAAARYCGGDVYALAERYFETVANVVNKTGATLIGHFDLIAKFNEQQPLFEETHSRYRAAWRAAADRLLQTGVPFEINTGAVFRGYRSIPYPSAEIMDYLKERGARFVLSSDAHSEEALRFSFDTLKKEKTLDIASIIV